MLEGYAAISVLHLSRKTIFTDLASPHCMLNMTISQKSHVKHKKLLDAFGMWINECRRNHALHRYPDLPEEWAILGAMWPHAHYCSVQFTCVIMSLVYSTDMQKNVTLHGCLSTVTFCDFVSKCSLLREIVGTELRAHLCVHLISILCW